MVPVPVMCLGSSDCIWLALSVPLLSVMCPWSPKYIVVAWTVALFVILILALPELPMFR